MKHYINLKVRNHYGVLSNVAGLFTRRGYNIDSIAVGETENPKVSSMTIVVHGDDQIINQISDQLQKLPDVITIANMGYVGSLTREFLLITIEATAEHRMQILAICDVFKGRVVDLSENTLTIEASGTKRQINGLVNMLKEFGILDMARTGEVCLPFQSKE